MTARRGGQTIRNRPVIANDEVCGKVTVDRAFAGHLHFDVDPRSEVAANNEIALDELYTWNPALNGDCSGLWPDYYICVGVGTTTATTTTTTTTTARAVETPTPTQAGIVSSCKSFYYVQSGDGCYDIAADNGVTLDNLYSWNPALNGDCSGLWPDYYICVGA
ncbi:hypothetical protein BJX76DRAFT_106069 [Aspergillus varians]